MPESVRFDRAVGFYDRTRALPPEVTARQAELLMAELGGASRVLEIGVGTGRIALTLDVPIIGLDLSRPMMDVLRAKGGQIPLVEGDATRLPFPDGCFNAAYAAHVFLIPDWQVALDELVRVVRPGGTLLACRGSGATDVGKAITARFFDALGIEHTIVGAGSIEDVDAAAARLGLRVRSLERLERTDPFRIGEWLESLAEGRWAATWQVDPEDRRRAVDAITPWVIEGWGSVDAQVPATSSFAWHAYDIP